MMDSEALYHISRRCYQSLHMGLASDLYSSGGTIQHCVVRALLVEHTDVPVMMENEALYHISRRSLYIEHSTYMCSSCGTDHFLFCCIDVFLMGLSSDLYSSGGTVVTMTIGSWRNSTLERR